MRPTIQTLTFGALLALNTYLYADYTIGTTGAYGSDEQSFISADALIDAIRFSDDRVMVGTARGLYHFEKNHQGYEISGGLGFREVLDDDLAYSIDAIFDHTKTMNDTYHNEVVIAGGYFQNNWGIRANGYIALSKTQDVPNPDTTSRVFILQERNINVLEAFGAGFFMNRHLEINVGGALSKEISWPAIKAQYIQPVFTIGSHELSMEAFARYDFFSVHKIPNTNSRSRDRFYGGVTLRFTKARAPQKSIRSILAQPMDHFTRDPDAFIMSESVATHLTDIAMIKEAITSPSSTQVTVTNDLSHSSPSTQRALLKSLETSAGNTPSYYQSDE